MSRILTPQVVLLIFSVAIAGMNSLILSPIAAAVAIDLNVPSASGVMIAAAAFGMVTALSALLLAPLADYFGPHRALPTALSIMVVAMVISATATSLPMLTAGQALVGISAGVALPSSYSLGAQVAHRGLEAQTLGVILSGWTISLVAGVSISGLVAEVLHWRWVFWGMGAVALVLVPSILSIRDWGERPERTTITMPWTAIQVPGILRGLSITLVYMFAFYGFYNFAGPHITDILGMSTAMAAFVPLAYGIGFGLAVPLDQIIDKHGVDRVARVLFPLLALTYVGLGVFAGSFWLLISFCVIWGGINHLGLNLVIGRLTALAPTKRVAIMGLYSTMTYTGQTVGSLGFKSVFDTYGLLWCGLLAACILTVASIDAWAKR